MSIWRETEHDRAQELVVVKKLVKRINGGRFTFRKVEPPHPFDFALIQGDRVRAGVEIKCRKGPPRDTFWLDLHKYIAMKQWQERSRLKLMLAYWWSGCPNYVLYNFISLLPDYPMLGMARRSPEKNRNDTCDDDIVVCLPASCFVNLSTRVRRKHT